MTWGVITGDCLEVMAGLEAGSVDHVVADPPYSKHVHSKSRAGNRKTPLLDGNGRMSRCAIDRERDFGFEHLSPEVMQGVAVQAARLTKRWSLFFTDVESVHAWKSELETAGLDYCRTGAWIKVGCTPQFTGDRPGVGFEAVAIAHPKGRKRWNGGGSPGIWTHLVVNKRGGMSHVSREHHTQKPLPLMLELVQLFTDPGELILDPFCGSGTTGVAALRLGRRFLGIEQNEAWAEIARERLRAEEQQLSLPAARAGQVPMFGKEGA